MLGRRSRRRRCTPPTTRIASLDRCRQGEAAGAARRLRPRRRPARDPGHGAASPATRKWCWWRAPTAVWPPTCGRWCASRSRSSSKQDGRREQGSRRRRRALRLRLFQRRACCATTRSRRCTRRCVNLAAQPAPAGNMTVVLGPGWPGILLHEAIGHGLEGDFNRKGSSAFSGRIGERVAAHGRHRGRRRHHRRPARLAQRSTTKATRRSAPC